MPRKRAKKDGNQTEVVEKLRLMGMSVAITHQLGGGFPDFVVGYRGKNYMIELKDENQPPSNRKLTDDEVEFHLNWRGQIDVANNLEDVVNIVLEK